MDTTVHDSFSLVMAARNGVYADTVFEVADLLQLHIKQVAHLLNTSSKTLHHYHQSGKKLNPVQSEQILKLYALQMKGKEVFSTQNALLQWLEKPAFGLDGMVPLALLETSGGIDLVMEELERIAYGDFA